MPIRSPKWLFVAALVLASPDTPGVFELWDDDEVVKVGATEASLRESLVHEMRARQVTHFSWEITFQPLARERELLAEYIALNHHAPRFNSEDG